jgi:hypothetical protein
MDTERISQINGPRRATEETRFEPSATRAPIINQHIQREADRSDRKLRSVMDGDTTAAYRAVSDSQSAFSC